jgi:hypothetical protein
VHRAPVAAERRLDRCAPLFERHRARRASPVHDRGTQAPGRDMRAHGVQVSRHPPARDPAHDPCIGVRDPAADAARGPGATRTWHRFVVRERVSLRTAGRSPGM